MRSLSLVNITVNKNMKLLILLIAVLAGTNHTSSKPYVPSKSDIYSEILDFLVELRDEFDDKATESLDLQIKTPHDIKNACSCEAKFEEHLNKSVMDVNKVLPRDHFENILDNLNLLSTYKNEANADCTFTKHNITSLHRINAFLIEKNINFIQNWNENCSRK